MNSTGMYVKCKCKRKDFIDIKLSIWQWKHCTGYVTCGLNVRMPAVATPSYLAIDRNRLLWHIFYWDYWKVIPCTVRIKWKQAEKITIATWNLISFLLVMLMLQEKLANILKPPKLLRHLKIKHPALEDKPVVYFERRRSEQDSQKQVLKSATSANLAAVKASYLMANRTAEAKTHCGGLPVTDCSHVGSPTCRVSRVLEIFTLCRRPEDHWWTQRGDRLPLDASMMDKTWWSVV